MVRQRCANVPPACNLHDGRVCQLTCVAFSRTFGQRVSGPILARPRAQSAYNVFHASPSLGILSGWVKSDGMLAHLRRTDTTHKAGWREDPSTAGTPSRNAQLWDLVHTCKMEFQTCKIGTKQDSASPPALSPTCAFTPYNLAR